MRSLGSITLSRVPRLTLRNMRRQSRNLRTFAYPWMVRGTPWIMFEFSGFSGSLNKNTCIFSRVIIGMTCTAASRHLYTTTTINGSIRHSSTGHRRVCTMLRSRVSKTTTLRAINPMEQSYRMPTRM